MDVPAALASLRSSDHVFLFPDAAREIAKALGVGGLVMQRQRVDSRAVKGLTVPGVRDGATVEGYCAAALARTICQTLNVEYRECFGRGSQLRECCNALDSHFSAGAK